MGEAKRRGTREERVAKAEEIVRLQHQAFHLYMEQQRQAQMERLRLQQEALDKLRAENPELAKEIDAAGVVVDTEPPIRRRGKSMLSGRGLASSATMMMLAGHDRLATVQKADYPKDTIVVDEVSDMKK